jgi:hypothetical protein
MISKTITYVDFNGMERTEKFYFNLTEAELVELEVDVEGGMKAILEKIIAENDRKQLWAYFKKVVLMAYGEKSPDGRFFRKNESIREGFAPTEACSKLLMELTSNTKAASDFINGILPDKISSQIDVKDALPAAN